MVNIPTSCIFMWWWLWDGLLCLLLLHPHYLRISPQPALCTWACHGDIFHRDTTGHATDSPIHPKSPPESPGNLSWRWGQGTSVDARECLSNSKICTEMIQKLYKSHYVHLMDIPLWWKCRQPMSQRVFQAIKPGIDQGTVKHCPSNSWITGLSRLRVLKGHWKLAESGHRRKFRN